MLAAWTLALALNASAEPISKAGDVLKNRDAIDGHSICAVGRIANLDERFGRVTGKHLFRADLDDGTGTLQVFAFGFFPRVANGEPVEVCGRYRKAKRHRNGVVYKDEIEVVALLKGTGVASGRVDIVDDKVVARGPAVKSEQAARPPSP